MIRVFSATDKVYTSNGDAVILPTKAKVKNSDNGEYYLELACPTEYSDYMQANNIIVAPTPQGSQPFRIKTVTKSKKRIEVKAYHVYYDSLNYLIADNYAVNKTCAEALAYFNAHTDTTSPFNTYSNVTTINSYRCVRTSLHDCINTILERWGGHLVRDKWDIKILATIGTDNGIVIEYKKNLQELTASYDWSGVCTKLLPVGKDGQLLDGLYMYSDIQYDIPYTKTVSFTQEIEKEDYPSEAAYIAALKADLRRQGEEYLNINSLPVINYTLKANPEKVTDIGDIIEVRDERIGVNVLTRVISYEYDCIADKYTSLEFGNFTPTLEGLMGNIQADTSNQITQATQNIDGAITAIASEVTTLSGSVSNLATNKQDKLTEGDHIDITSNVIKCTIDAGDGLAFTGESLGLKPMTTYLFDELMAVKCGDGQLAIFSHLPIPINTISLNSFEILLYTSYGDPTHITLKNTDTGIVSSISSASDYGFQLLIEDNRLNSLDGMYLASVSLRIRN